MEQEVKSDDNNWKNSVQPLRKFLIEYCQKKTQITQEKKYYQLGWFQGNDYFGFPINSIRILAASDLEAVLIFKDYSNEFILRETDAYDDDCFWDEVNTNNDDIYALNWDNYKTDEFLKTLFQSECIDGIIENYIHGWHENDTLWLEIATEPRTLTASF